MSGEPEQKAASVSSEKEREQWSYRSGRADDGDASEPPIGAMNRRRRSSPVPPSTSLLRDLEAKSTRLEMLSAIGMNGRIIDGMSLHPDEKEIVFPLGCSIVVMEVETRKQEYLAGHTNQVICVTVSKSGKYVASGQVNHMGFPAPTYIWDFAARKAYATHSYHKVSVEDVAFSASEKYLASLGGQDDNSLVIYDIEQRSVLCGLEATPRMPGVCTRLIGFSVGYGKIRMWEYNPQRRTLSYHDCCNGQMRRYVNSIKVDSLDRNIFVGTKSGDIVHIVMSRELAESPLHPEPLVVGALCRKLSKEESKLEPAPQFSSG